MANHSYQVTTTWTGNLGEGTASYRSYSRAHTVTCSHGLVLYGSADKTFHGDSARWNPEELLLAALSQCHMMSYLHAAAEAGVIVESYEDRASGLLEQRGRGGRFLEATLHPVIKVSKDLNDEAEVLHERAAADCFIAASVNFPVKVQPSILTV